MSQASIDFAVSGPVARIALARPDQGNGITLPLARDLLDATIRCDEDPAIRCVVLTGTGRMFSVGGDIAGFVEAGDRLGAYLKELTTTLHAAINHLALMAKPLVGAINGPAAGAGFSLAILPDLVVAARSAHFTAAYTALGVTPDGGLTWLLPRLVGLRRAQELILTNRRVAADEALAIGLVTRIVEDGELADAVDTLATGLAAGATRALGAARRQLLDTHERSLFEQMAHESRSIAAAAIGPEGREGVAAFLAKRKPEFPS